VSASDIIAVFIMCKLGSKWKEVLLGCSFVILIESITVLHKNYSGIYTYWIYVFYAYICYIFYMVSPKSSFMLKDAYIFHLIAYAVFGFEALLSDYNVIMGYGFSDTERSVIMHGCLMMLVFAVIYDKLSTIKYGRARANFYLP